jgi:cardiolipin synthase|uniref:CDP-diacylglycerol--glycerol-3-phosphate 3-phosphatidyltransferase n=1 Tax=Desulfobacca acetoxidans TaxID=60893 RepID=A0A7C5AN04_9BACT
MRTNADYSRVITIPNLITLFRILLTPIFIICLIQGYHREALSVFILAGITDLADGLVARVWGQRSPLGTYLDPLADKLLLSSSFIALSIYRLIPPWLMVVVLSRDLVLVLGVLVFTLASYPILIRPTWAGKLSAGLQMAAVFLVLSRSLWVLPQGFLQGWFWLTAGFTTGSGIHYVLRALGEVARSSQNKDHSR